MIKRICLIHLPDESSLFGNAGIKLPPLSMGIIISHLRQQGYSVEPFDLRKKMAECYSETHMDKLEQFFCKDTVFDYMAGNANESFDVFAEKLFSGINLTTYDLIAYSVGPGMSWIQTHSGLILGKFVKDNFQKTQVFGGLNLNNIISFSPVYDQVLRLFLDHFQYVVQGAGEEALLQIINTLNQGKDYQEIKKIKGVAFVQEDGTLCFNKQQKRKIICPDFDGLELDYYRNYLNKSNSHETITALYGHPFLFTSRLQFPPEKNRSQYQKKLVIPYIFNYGCPYNCAFCVESDPDSPTPAIGKVDTVIDHLESLTHKYDTPYFYFINNAVNCSKKYINDLCDGILERKLNIHWSDCARFDNVDLDILKKMKQAGCKKLVFGLEIASIGMIDRINKKLDLEFTEQVLQWCNEIGIWAELEIIVGLPTETQENFEESFNYLNKNMKYINFLAINRYIPLTKSIMFRYPEKFGIEIVQKYSFEDILQKDLEKFRNKKNTSDYVHMMKVFQFREINGRSSEQVQEDTEERFSRVEALHSQHLSERVKNYMKKGYLSMKDISYLLKKK